MQKICFVMVGVSGSGKSTVQTKLATSYETPNKYAFSLDSLRLAYTRDKHPQGFELWETMDPSSFYSLAFKFVNEHTTGFDKYVTASWKEALKADVLFIDNTNLSRKSRNRWVTEARKAGFFMVAVEMLTPLDVVLERQKTRGDKYVPEATVRDMYMRQQAVMVGSEVDVIMYVDGTSSDKFQSTMHFN